MTGGKPIIQAGGVGNPAWSGRAVRAKLALSRHHNHCTPLKVLMPMPFPIRRLTAADASAYRDIRLEGLARHPDGFGSAWEDEAEQPLALFEQRIVNAAVFGGFLGNENELAGVAGLMVPQGAKQRHKGVLMGMYVRPAARGTGMALALVQAVLSHARTVVEEVQLTVAPHNEAAQRLYRSVGFVEYAREPRSLKIDGKYQEAVLMTLPFGPLFG